MSKSAAVKQRFVEDAPVTKIVAVILKHAVEGNASDVHIEHTGEKVRVRFRVDGVMYTSLILPVNIHNAVVARIKILAQLKLDEKRKPQDGRFSARMDDKKVDFRVSNISRLLRRKGCDAYPRFITRDCYARQHGAFTGTSCFGSRCDLRLPMVLSL